ncbi:hypothetical protein KASHIRA_02060 [Serratia phage vB_SmaM-Kashira]|nr:hypothetical protein KASHIRA_02060 [Serratia phage vB_SmaM-Kashira]
MYNCTLTRVTSNRMAVEREGSFIGMIEIDPVSGKYNESPSMVEAVKHVILNNGFELEPSKDPISLMVCEDCRLFWANGEHREEIPAEWEAKIEKSVLRLDRLYKFLGNGEKETDFTPAACECCNYRAAGARFELIGYQR